jgi:hypothetical protein
MTQKVRFRERNISFKDGEKVVLGIRNDSPNEARIQLKLVGSSSYRVAKEDLHLTLKPHQDHSVAVKFSTAMTKGWPIATNVKHEALLQIWDTSGKQLIDSSVLKGRGPALVPVLHCLTTTGIKPRFAEKHRSPPAIFLEVVIPDTSISVNTGNVAVNWSVDGADEVYELHGGPGAEVLPADNMSTDLGLWTGPPTSSDNGSFTYTPGSTIAFGISARNPDGQSSKTLNIYQTARFGYHDSCTPAGGSVHQSELDRVRGYLEAIEASIRTNRLVNLAYFIERWNAVASAENQIPELDDMDYLTGPVGSGNLADDMLNTMQSMLVYLSPGTLPEGYRPGTITDPDFHSLCESYIYEGDTYTDIGKTIWHNNYPDRSWLGICLDLGANDLTLLHELYHLTTHKVADIEEKKAVAVSCCCFDYIPW